MKKFLTFSVALLAGMTSFAGFCNTPDGKLSAQEVLNKLGSPNTVMKFVASDSDRKEKPQSAEDETRAPLWNTIGTGYFQDFVIASLFTQMGQDVDVQCYEVEIQENAKTPGTYRILNPYMSFDLTNYLDITYNAMDDHHMIIHTDSYNGTDYCWVEDFSTGLEVQGMGAISVMTQTEGLFASGSGWTIENIFDQIPDVLGSFDKENGVMRYPTSFQGPTQDPNTGQIIMKDLANFVAYTGKGTQNDLAWVANLRTDPFLVVLPGHKMPEPENPFDVYTYYGKGTLNNNFFTATFQTVEQPETEVEIYENPDNGKLIVRHAWTSWSENGMLDETPFTLELYDPSCILVTVQYTGVNSMLDESGYIYPINIMSNSFWYALNNKTSEDFFREAPETNVYLDIENKRIVFPPMSMLPCVLLNEGKSVQLLVLNENYAYESYLTLPDEYVDRFAGVEDIVGDQEFDGPVKYYNLQGVEVANPEKGQLVIKRQGSKTTKMIVR